MALWTDPQTQLAPPLRQVMPDKPTSIVEHNRTGLFPIGEGATALLPKILMHVCPK